MNIVAWKKIIFNWVKLILFIVLTLNLSSQIFPLLTFNLNEGNIIELTQLVTVNYFH